MEKQIMLIELVRKVNFSVLNPDIKITPENIYQLYEFMENNNNYALIGPILNQKKTNTTIYLEIILTFFICLKMVLRLMIHFMNKILENK